jgi:hypothetical protein
LIKRREEKRRKEKRRERKRRIKEKTKQNKYTIIFIQFYFI